MSAARPALRTRLAAALRGEVAASTVEAYRQAGAVAYQDLLAAEDLRRKLLLSGTTLWTASPAQAGQLLATWNAFALQTLGDQLIEADYRADPQTVGYLPPVTAEQAARFLGEVEFWSGHAHRAAADAGYDLSQRVYLPARLPGWVEVEPCPVSHLSAMVASAGSLRDRAEAAMADFVTAVESDSHLATAGGTVRGLLAAADAAASYGQSLAAAAPTDRRVHERVESSLKRAIDLYYLLGQLMAMPDLLNRPDVQVASAPGQVGGPGEPGFDPWCLTDQPTRQDWQRDPAARQAIDRLWRYDPDPQATLAIQAEIDTAAKLGAITPALDRRGIPIGHYFCCPWGTVYVVNQPVRVAGRQLRPGDQFTFDVSAEEIPEGGAFVRRLVIGPFSPTDEVDYCDPEAPERS